MELECESKNEHVNDENEDFGELDYDEKASSHRQKFLKAQIMDEKVSLDTEETFDIKDYAELVQSSIEQLPENNSATLKEMDETLENLRTWQQGRESDLRRKYAEATEAAEAQVIQSKTSIHYDSEELPETNDDKCHVADWKTIESLKAMIAVPPLNTDKLLDLSRLEEQVEEASSGYPSPEKLRRQLQTLSFAQPSSARRLSQHQLDMETYKKEDMVLEQGAALEEDMGLLEAKLRDFSGDLDLLLHGSSSGPTPSEEKQSFSEVGRRAK